MFYTNTKEQAFYTDVEVAMITTYSIILITIELAKLGKYKLPLKEKEVKEFDSANQSIHELLSNRSKQSEIDERLLRKNALERIIKYLDMKHKGEGMFGEKILPGPGNPHMRYSIQDPKSPFYPDETLPLDNRRFDSEPAIKHKAYPETQKPNPLSNSLTKSLQKPKRIKEDHKETLSEIRRREEEDFQTDDKPSEIGDRKLNSSGNLIPLIFSINYRGWEGRRIYTVRG